MRELSLIKREGTQRYAEEPQSFTEREKNFAFSVTFRLALRSMVCCE